MFPLDEVAMAKVLAWDLGEQRSLSLRHALIHRTPGLLGDHPRSPKSVLLVCENPPPDDWHIYGAGMAEPAIGWLARCTNRFALIAPESWEGAIRKRSISISKGVVETWVRDPSISLFDVQSLAVTTRLLNENDVRSFELAAPEWALRGWRTYRDLIREGLAVGVPMREGGFASVAWIFESDDRHDALAVATLPRFQRLGLGRSAAANLIDQVESVRKRTPVWTVNAQNLPSRALARSLGFSPRSRESVLRWSA
jgi:GNAT superfamily N-acetyltransferase